MKRFRFQLEVVLKERKRIEDLKLREWTLAIQILKNLEIERIQLASRLSQAYVEATELTKVSKNSSAEYSIIDDFIRGTQLRIHWKSGEILKASRVVERKRAEYVVERQKREALQKLKDRRLKEHQVKVKKHEAKLLDDIYLTKHWTEEDEGIAI